MLPNSRADTWILGESPFRCQTGQPPPALPQESEKLAALVISTLS
jgi:hypothetical protein